MSDTFGEFSTGSKELPATLAILPLETTTAAASTATALPAPADAGAARRPRAADGRLRNQHTGQSAKRGETPKKSLKGASREMEKSMSETELEELAHTRRRGLPEKQG